MKNFIKEFTSIFKVNEDQLVPKEERLSAKEILLMKEHILLYLIIAAVLIADIIYKVEL